jgi:hypothetical protein
VYSYAIKIVLKHFGGKTMKKVLAILLTVCMIAALTVTAGAEDREWEKISLRGDREWCGAIIDTAEVGLEQGKNYVLELNVNFLWAGDGLRIRYSDWPGEGSWTNNANDGAGHSTDAAKFSGTTASQIPAELPTQDGGEASLTVNFTFGADAEGNFANMDNTQFINIFGHSGFDGYEVISMRLKDSSGAVLAEIGFEDGGNGGNGENGGNGGNGANGVDGDKKPVDTGIGDVAVASAIALVAVGAVVFSRKRK